MRDAFAEKPIADVRHLLGGPAEFSGERLRKFGFEFVGDRQFDAERLHQL
jgi:hypothetical protein